MLFSLIAQKINNTKSKLMTNLTDESYYSSIKVQTNISLWDIGSIPMFH